MVVDASVLTNALTDDGPIGNSARAELTRDAHWCAPQHLVVEVFAAIRGRWLGGDLSDKRAEDALAALVTMTIQLVDVAPLVRRMWELRKNLTGYDAAYVALAETFGCPLVTSDARLARVGGLDCEIRLAVG